MGNPIKLAWQNRGRIGPFTALLAAAIYGLSQVLQRKIVTETAPPLVTTAFALMFGFIFLFALFHRSTLRDIGKVPKRAWFFVILAGLTSSYGVLFLFLALSKSPVVLVSPVVSTNPLVTMTLTYLFLQHLERVTPRIVIGGLLIIGGATLITLTGST